MFFNTAQAGIITEAPSVARVLNNALNFLLEIFGFFAIIGLAVAGVMYLTAGGNEDRIKKAKKAFIYSVAGIIIALGAWVIVKQIINLI